MEEKETKAVLKALNRATWKGRKVIVEVAGEEDKENAGKRGKTIRTNKAEADRKPAKVAKTKTKPSREERGYTKPRGKKDDWKQFFQHDNDLRGPEPDFDEEGWAKPSKKKNKK